MRETPEYLVDKRKLTKATLTDPRFVSIIRTDTNNGNAVFPYFNDGGLCTYEYKNVNSRGIASGSEKGLWFSQNIKEAGTIVICESVIDALSHAEMKPNENAAYVSFGGSMSSDQEKLVIRLLKKSKENSVRVLIAVDNDEAGDRYADKFRAWGEELNLPIEIDLPLVRGQDWNDCLKAMKDQENDDDIGLSF